MPRDLIVVGRGDYWTKLINPSLDELRNWGLINNVTTIDVVDKEIIPGTKHVVKQKDQPLSEVSNKIGYEKPFMILSHPNNLHVSDAIEVMKNSSHKSKPKLMIEKPYAINDSDLEGLENLLKKESGNVALLEYYLNMKGVPLLMFGGKVRENSFYFENNGIIKNLDKEHSLKEYSGKLEEMIGKPIQVISDVLEGEGSYGTIQHRDLFIIDKYLGGGMIQDLGHHSLTPIMALEDYIGKIDSNSLKEVKTAYCNEYVESVKERGVPKENIGESYAELKFITSKGVPVKVSIGKYVEGGTNQRRIVIVGTKGIVPYDITNNILAYQHRDNNLNIRPLMEADKKGVPKYLAVVRASMEYVNKNNPFYFDPIDVAFNAQKIVLDSLNRSPSDKRNYKQGEMHDKIFE